MECYKCSAGEKKHLINVLSPPPFPSSSVSWLFLSSLILRVKDEEELGLRPICLAFRSMDVKLENSEREANFA